MPEDLSVLLTKLNSLSPDFDVTQTFDGHGDRPLHGPTPVHTHTCTRKEVSDEKSKAILDEIKILGISKANILDWFEWLDNVINGKSPKFPFNNDGNLKGRYSRERQTLLTLIYKIPSKIDLVRESYTQKKFSYCTEYTTFSSDSRDVHCRVTIYDNVRSVLNEMSTWKRRFREALDSTQQVEYDSLYNGANQSAEAWMSVAVPRMGTQALAYSRARQVSNPRRTLR